jgi:hypothetical protein
VSIALKHGGLASGTEGFYAVTEPVALEGSFQPSNVGITQMLDRIFKSDAGPGPVEYVVMLIVLKAMGLVVMSSAPRIAGVPMTQKPVAVDSKG